jgi:hypothetical protein
MDISLVFRFMDGLSRTPYENIGMRERLGRSILNSDEEG